MQVKTTTSAPVPSLSIESRPGDFEVTGPVAAYVAPVMALSREDLVAALLQAEWVSTEVLAGMDDAEIRHAVGFVLAADGLSSVHDTVTHERGVRHRDAALIRHLELCEVKVASAFGLAAAAPAVRRSRIGDVVARQRRIVVRAA